ncbi:glucans biosynthesis glucosyltransferase MdoH [Pseudomonas sp. LRF_L74]|uniref:glucans biosynthesis glucosyltransferase MdoH n=1 Tax=Pseudomonas sp. LRF_L74 TaxID=3369422 RepID=UPI003F62EFC2
MNKITDSAAAGAAYREQLGLVELDGDTEGDSDVLLGGLANRGRLNGATGEAALDSVGKRLELGWPDLKEEALVQDSGQRVCLKAVPPVKRTRMLPEPWATNPLVRGWHHLFGGKKKHERPPVEADESAHWRKVGAFRRFILLLLMLAQTGVATWYMIKLLPYQGWGLVDLDEVLEQHWLDSVQQVLPYVLQTSILILFSLLCCWVAAGFWTALMGFWELMSGRDKYAISYSIKGDEVIAAEARTALVMPICNEDVARVFAGLRATYDSVKATGQLERFDFFILSDSNQPDVCVAEQQAWLDLCREVDGFGHVFYRRRRRRVKRKSGNIDDFCRRWGGDYRYMVVLDADSVMSGECLTNLVRIMEANPTAGIVQTAPKASGMDTLYARMQQYATRVYGPLFTAGLHFWQLGESHYWGHNAIIRMKPFIEHCALAPLPGKGSFAGAILSHDFVEAALMRRAGWGVWIAYDLPGSYEELPPNLLDELKRDRRWCHGNLMNFRLFLVKGMHPVHRAVFLTGVMSYLSAPLWFLFLVLSTALLAVHQLMEPQYFLQPRQLFPLWPQWKPEEAIALFSTTMFMLFFPKLLSVLLICVKGAKAYGGRLRVLLSMLLEALFSMLLAPVRMVFHTLFVTAAFLGWEAQWKSPQRDDDATPWSEAIRRHGFQTLLGISWTALVAWLNPNFLWWLAPIVGSLTLSIPVSVFSSRRRPGLAARDARLFLIPEEYDVPKELSNTDAHNEHNREIALQKGFIKAVVNPRLNALACAMGTARHASSALIEKERQAQVDKALEVGPTGLDDKRRLFLLSDPVALSRLHAAVWRNRVPAWLESPWSIERTAAVPVHTADSLAKPQAAL